MDELLERLKAHIEIITTGLKHDGSWMRPIHVSDAERWRHGQEAFGIIEELQKNVDNFKLRRMLAIAIAGARLYGDDGELQDSTTFPYIDFLRDSPDLILKKLEERAMKKMLDDPKR